MGNIEQEAEYIVANDRKKDYGDIHESFTRIAGLWSAYTGFPIDKFDVAKMMILLKVSRAKNTNHHDSYLDIIGYVKCVEELLEIQNSMG